MAERHIDLPGGIVVEQASPDGVQAALEAVLLFHAPIDWDCRARLAWGNRLRNMERRDVTTRALCDFVRAELRKLR